MAIANHNGCDYCNSAYTYVDSNVAGLEDAEIAANREDKSLDAKTDEAVRFAFNVAKNRGKVAPQGIEDVRAAWVIVTVNV